MATIDIKLKSYDELTFEITKLNTVIFLKDKEIERLNNIINKIEKESYLGMNENTNNNDYSKGLYTAYEYINNKVKELKESGNNE